MRGRALLIDAVLVAVCVALVLVLSPGLAIVAILALVALLVCGATLAIGRLRARHRR